MDGYLDCFDIITNNNITSILVHVFWCTYPGGYVIYTSRSEILGTEYIYTVIFIYVEKLYSKVVLLILLSIGSAQELPLFNS